VSVAYGECARDLSRCCGHGVGEAGIRSKCVCLLLKSVPNCVRLAVGLLSLCFCGHCVFVCAPLCVLLYPIVSVVLPLCLSRPISASQ
jgi:hypothetical protein